ncbi:MAG: hypothetical protein ABIR78_15055 [Ferruginibacter sp.]
MKDYASYAKGSISMSKDTVFIDTVESIINKNDISYIVESGTYMGTGSTRTISDILVKTKKNIKKFYTIEVDNAFFRKAKKNLKKYLFVEPIWGISIDPEEAIQFVNSDDAIMNHEKYPDVFIDTLNNPVEFYTNEIRGQFSRTSLKPNLWDKIFKQRALSEEKFRTNVFSELLPKIKDTNPIILLDSAGGIGLLEFNTVLKYMSNNKFIIILDDIHHLKHFRSLAYIENSPNFIIINKSIQDGWVIASYQP